MAKHRATEAPADPAPSPSPLSGSLYITVCEARYNGVGEWRQLLFPNMQESEAERMATYLDTYTAPEGALIGAEYRNIRIAHCQYTEIPDYNDTDPLS